MAEITEKQLIQSLKELKKIKPDQNWVVFCRGGLTAKFNTQSEGQKAGFQRIGLISIFRNFSLPRFALKPIAVFLGIFFFISGTGLAAFSGAQKSLPGDRLFPVKIALEQARLFATTSAEGKERMQSEMFGMRIDELSKVVELGGSIEDKAPRIEEAVSNLQKQLLTMKDELPRLDKQAGPKKIVETAKKIDANAFDAQQALSQAKLSLSPKIEGKLNEKIAEASETADKASNEALEAMVMNQGESGISQEEIVAKLGQKIQNTENQMKFLNEAVANSASGNKLPINASIILDETDKAIEEAKASLENNDMAGALETIKAASEMVKSAQKLVDSASSGLPADTENDDSNASSTQSVATSTNPSIK
jgi:hypothetical protein